MELPKAVLRDKTDTYRDENSAVNLNDKKQ